MTEPHHEKTSFMPYVNNKRADQPAHPRSPVSTFVVCCLDSIISLVSFFAISWLSLICVAVQPGRKPPKTGFLVMQLSC